MKGLQAPMFAVKAVFRSAMKKAFPSLPEEALEPILSNSKFGDYQYNSVMSIFKNYRSCLGDVRSPKAVADILKARLDEEPEAKILFSNIVVAPQGFVTVNISPQWIEGTLKPVFRGCIEIKADEPQNVLVDYSSPNIAKEMHVGHLRSTIIGESLCRILEFVGHTVKRTNHVGDWGTQFGMLIEYLREEYPNFITETPDLTDLTAFYKKAKARFDADEVFKKKSQLAVVQLQRGDPEARKAWKLFCDISRADFQKIYDRLGVCLEEKGESYYNEMIPPIVTDLEKRGLIIESEGAKCFFCESDPEKRETEVPLMIVKSDGGFGYDSTDLAAIHYRLVTQGNSWVIYITDLGQEPHFIKIFKAAEIIGWYKPQEGMRCDHAGFGLVQGEDGKKFKTRSGETVRLVDLLDEAVERALNELKKRREEDEDAKEEGDENGSAARTLEEDKKAAAAIGYSAVKYFDLKQNRHTNYRFSFDKMLDPRGNTAVYMLYAYARICAIFRKAGVEAETLDEANLKLETPEERQLGLVLLRLPEILEQILGDLYLHRLAEYMYDLSGVFTAFYQTCRVVGVPQSNSRLVLCELTRKVLEQSFHLLGIQPLQRL